MLQPRADGPGTEAPVRYGPTEVNLKPRDQLRPLLPTWNPPPTRPPQEADLKNGLRLRCKFEDRWWAATVRNMEEDGRVKVGYDGWPSRHDEVVQATSDRLYLHESHHPEYEAPPIPQRYQRPVPKDEHGNPLPVAPRAPRPKMFDPEKERLKRALRPPLPYNPEKERLKRLLRGQSAPVVEAPPQVRDQRPAPELRTPRHAAEPNPAARASPSLTGPAVPKPPAAVAGADSVEWLEVPGGQGGARAFRHATTGEVRVGPPPSGWVELIADGGARYYWHVERQVTVWERPN